MKNLISVCRNNEIGLASIFPSVPLIHQHADIYLNCLWNSTSWTVSMNKGLPNKMNINIAQIPINPANNLKIWPRISYSVHYVKLLCCQEGRGLACTLGNSFIDTPQSVNELCEQAILAITLLLWKRDPLGAKSGPPYWHWAKITKHLTLLESFGELIAWLVPPVH